MEGSKKGRESTMKFQPNRMRALMTGMGQEIGEVARTGFNRVAKVVQEMGGPRNVAQRRATPAEQFHQGEVPAEWCDTHFPQIEQKPLGKGY